MDGPTLLKAVADAVDFITGLCPDRPRVGIVLGSGLGPAADAAGATEIVGYQDIPHFPQARVPGHIGQLVIGRLADKTVLALRGRLHYYEGYTMQEVTFAVRVLAGCGIDTLVLTNAAGSLRPDMRPGDFMLIRDHLNFMGDNPLVGLPVNSSSSWFVDMTGAYDSNLIKLAEATVSEDIPLRHGVLAAVRGPAYETPAEAEFLRRAGADAVSMSTVPEVIMGRYLGLKVLALSCIANVVGQGAPSHEEVVLVTGAAAGKLADWLPGIVAGM